MLSSTSTETGLDAILEARAIIARFGEQDAMAWWDDESLMSSGAFVMGRLFPRTTAYAQVEVAIEAATLRHQALVPQPARVTLFRLPPLLESEARQRMLGLKRESASFPLLSILKDVDVRRPLDDVVLEIGAIDADDLAVAGAAVAHGRTLVLGTLGASQLETDDEVRTVIRRLVAGYTTGSRGNLVIPVYELESARS